MTAHSPATTRIERRFTFLAPSMPCLAGASVGLAEAFCGRVESMVHAAIVTEQMPATLRTCARARLNVREQHAVRLIRHWGQNGPEVAALVDGQVVGLGNASLRALIRDQPNPQALGTVAQRRGSTQPGPLLAPINDPGKIIAIGLNYVDHAAESAMAVPRNPIVFAKFPSSIIGPGEAIRFSRSLTKAVDFEAELAVVIGRPARRVAAGRALDYVFGYTCFNDVSARDLQFSDGQWVRGKSLDTFAPIGPWIVTADEISDPQSLAIRCRVSGETLQSASTEDMIFPVAELIARLSEAFTLEPGDVIATGTPPGVGWFREPKRLLADGDEVVVDITGIGQLKNPVVEDT